jgi:hypothetical protein
MAISQVRETDPRRAVTGRALLFCFGHESLLHGFKLGHPLRSVYGFGPHGVRTFCGACKVLAGPPLSGDHFER